MYLLLLLLEFFSLQLESRAILIYQMAYGALKIEDHLRNGFSDGCKDLLLR